MRFILGGCVCAAVATVGACASSGGGGEADVAVRDSAGVTIVENGQPDLSRVLSAILEVEIGVVEGPEEYQLFRVSDVTRLVDGAIVVADGGSRDVRVFEADGRHRVTFGGAGQGPGEFGYPVAVFAAPGDTILVQDRMDRAWFGPDGTFLRRTTTDRDALVRLFADGSGSEGGSWLPDGSLFAPIYQWNTEPPRAGPLFRPPMTLVRIDSELSSLDTLGEYGGIEQQYVDVGGRRGVSATVPPFSSNTSWGVARAGGAIAVGDNAAPEVHLIGRDGAKRVVRWRAEPEPIAAGEVSEWIERQRSASWTQGQLPELERAWAQMDVPEVKPYYGQVSLGSDGRLWVAASPDFRADPAQFMVFGAEGVLEGLVSIPGPFRVFDAAVDWMLGVYRDETEVEFVRLYRISAPVQ